ncbi:MAG: nucleotidyltransferase family protein [Bacillota bacterium]
MRIGCVLMAAGAASRFGSNKLLSTFRGIPLCEHAFRALPHEFFYRCVAVTGYDQVAQIARRYKYGVVTNFNPAAGASFTVRLGTRQLFDADAALFAVADQPLLKKESVKRLLALYRENPGRIVSLAYGERRGNPAVFPRAYFDELMSLSGDQGGSAVIREHPEALLLCQVEDERELFDVDTAKELESLSEGGPGGTT